MFKNLVVAFLFSLVTVGGYAQQKHAVLPTNDLQQEKLLREELSHSLPDTNRIRLLIQLGNNYIGRGSTKDSNSDSAYRYYNVASALADKLHATLLQKEILQRFAHYYYQIADKKSAAMYESKLLAIYQQDQDPFNEAKSLSYMGEYAPDLNSAHAYFEKARLLFKKTGHKVEEIGVTQQWGDFLMNEGKNDSSTVVLMAALHQYQAIGYKKLADIYDELGSISDVKGYVNDELFYYLEAVKCMEAAGYDENVDRHYHRLGVAYSKSHKYERCLFYTLKAMSFGRRRTLFPAASWASTSLVSLKRPADALTMFEKVLKHDQPITMTEKTILNVVFAGIYTAQKKYDKAEKYYLAGINLYKVPVELGNRNIFIEVQNKVRLYTAIIKFYILTNQYQKARVYLSDIPESDDKKISPKFLCTIDQLRFKVDSALGNYVSAIRFFQTYIKINDSLNSIKNAKAVAEIDVKYQTTKKEHAIRMLESQQHIEKILVQKAVAQRNITLAAIAIGIILTVFLYNSYRRKKLSALLIAQKNNQLQILLADKEESNSLINRKNDQLQLLLIEKDWLLKEVHHRVKNNLHTVFCLLESQAKYLADDALKAVEVSQHRIYAMSLIHQKLYQSEDIKTVDMSTYLLEFIGYLIESFDTGNYIRFESDFESVTLNIAQAIPVALIINEAVTNAIKYAFPAGRSGTITISLKKDEEDIWLNITDNGIGIGSLLDLEQLNSLGLVLMQGLTEDLHGIFTINSDQGTQVEVVFPVAVALGA